MIPALDLSRRHGLQPPPTLAGFAPWERAIAAIAGAICDGMSLDARGRRRQWSDPPSSPWSPCPTTTVEAHAWHERVRRDAELPSPTTPHGRALRASARQWPGLGQIGECLCRSSLVFHAEPDDAVAAAWGPL